MCIGYTEQFYCSDCGTPLDYARKIDPVIYVRNAHGQDRDYCEACADQIIREAVQEICAALQPEPDSCVVAMYPWCDAAE